MKARAPGKIVISGAYAVLEGAPAIVSAVDRWVLADGARTAEFVTPEVRAALGDARAPWFDASALFERECKLGLGASAAILVASLAALRLEDEGALSDAELARAVLAPALAAHARAQGGGSGADVAAASFGGTLSFRRGKTGPEVAPVTLPPGVVVEVWWSGRSASTRELVGRVRALGKRDPARYQGLMARQTRAAEDAESAVAAADPARFVRALAEQAEALAALGAAAGADIVDSASRSLAAAAFERGCTALPAGAGGGDVLLHVGTASSSPEFRALAARLAHEHLPVTIGARGVHVVTNL